MQLNNFGSILSFAEELESKDEAFYNAALAKVDDSNLKSMLEQNIADAKKNIKNIQRTRRENVTEMILEGISDFSAEAYSVEAGDPSGMSQTELVDTAKKLEDRAERYYLDAAEKIKALSEVSRALKMIAKKRTAHKNKLAEL